MTLVNRPTTIVIDRPVDGVSGVYWEVGYNRIHIGDIVQRGDKWCDSLRESVCFAQREHAAKSVAIDAGKKLTPRTKFRDLA